MSMFTYFKCPMMYIRLHIIYNVTPSILRKKYRDNFMIYNVCQIYFFGQTYRLRVKTKKPQIFTFDLE